MSLQWNDQDLQEFFGTTLFPTEFVENKPHICWINYSGNLLKYELILDVANEIASISGDIQSPFGGDSMFEFSVACDHIVKIQDGCDPGKSGLAFWYGNISKKQNRTMIVCKRPDNDLQIWPSCVLPSRHPNYEMYAPE